jgi:hypothetical protein
MSTTSLQLRKNQRPTALVPGSRGDPRLGHLLAFGESA